MRKEVIGAATLYLGDCLTVLPSIRAICECVAKMQAAKNEADRRFGQPHYGHARE